MAFPFIWENNAETGLHGATASSGTLIDVPHYSTLARFGQAPYRGAYCHRIRLAGGTTSQFIREDTAFDGLTAAVASFLRWYFYLGKDFAMADTDSVSMVEAESTLNTTTEIAAGVRRNGSNLEFWYNETQAAASPGTIVLGTTSTALGRWFCAELAIVLDAGGGNDGTITGYIDDAAGTAVTALDQAAIVDVKFGAIGPDAGTSGSILIDDIKYDDTQIFRDKERFPGINVHVTHTNDHPLIGPGRFSVGITGTGTNAVLNIYDTDGVPTNLTPIVTLRNVSANEFIPGHDIFDVKHGAYCVMSGTAAQAFLSVDSGGVVSQGQYTIRGRATGRPHPGP
jgi:hypothetical protein